MRFVWGNSATEVLRIEDKFLIFYWKTTLLIHLRLTTSFLHIFPGFLLYGFTIHTAKTVLEENLSETPLVPCSVQGQRSNLAKREIPFSPEDGSICIPQKDLESESSFEHQDIKKSLEAAHIPHSVFVLSDSQKKAKGPFRDEQCSIIKAHQFLS